MSKTKAKSGQEKFSAKVLEIFSKLKNKSVKLPMLEQAILVNKLSKEHKLPVDTIYKKSKKSFPYVYNLLNLAQMSPKMKNYVMSGKIKGSDAIKLLRVSKEEKEFIKNAEALIAEKKQSKTENTSTVNSKTKRGRGRPAKVKATTNETVDQPKKGRGRPKKVQETSTSVETAVKKSPGRPKKVESAAPVIQFDDRKQKIKGLIMKFLGNKLPKKNNKSIDMLVEELIAN